MKSHLTFDTLGYMKLLRDGGFDQNQAEVLTNVNSEAFEQIINLKELATKKDINFIKTEIEKVRIEMDKLKIELKKFIVFSIIGTASLITSIQIILPFLKTISNILGQ